MNLIKPHNLEENIISLLLGGEARATTLLDRIRLGRKNTTKQGLYAALRKLKQDDVILTYKGTVSLSRVWVQEMRTLFDRTGTVYKTNQALSDVLGLENKESLTYVFANIKNMDTFWGHSQNILMHNTPVSEPIYGYDPHYWIYIARMDIEKELLKEIADNKRQFLMTVGNSYPLDKIIKKDFHSDFVQYNLNRLFEGENYYFTVIGDYITEVFLDKSLCEQIHALYQREQELNPTVIESLKSFLNLKGKNKIKISRNKARAERLKKKLRKDFYIIRPK